MAVQVGHAGILSNGAQDIGAWCGSDDRRRFVRRTSAARALTKDVRARTVPPLIPEEPMQYARQSVFVLFTVAVPLAAQGGWVQRLPIHSPPPRGWHCLAYDVARGVHVLFGGGGAAMHDDTWEWNGLDWSQRTPATVPPRRSGHAMTYDLNRGRVVMTCGQDMVGFLADTWEFDGVDWARRLPLQSPPQRSIAGLAFSFARGRSILFGGQPPSSTTALGDTWEWDGSNWTQLAPANAPPARYAFGMTSDMGRDRVLVFGGFDGANDLADAWAFDGVDWAPLPATQSPPPLTNTALAIDLPRGVLVQFGGLTFSVGQTPTNGTWLHDGTDWRRDARPTAITARRAFALSYDWPRDRFVLFGGFRNGYLDETWEYDLTGVAQWTVFGPGCPGSQGVPQLRAAGPQRAILGTSFGLAVTGVTGGALLALGFSNTNWNGNALPLSLSGFGMPGCELNVSPDVMLFAPGSGGVAQVALSIPATPGLVGVTFFAQALVPEPGANPFGAVVSNAAGAMVGSF